MAIEPKLSTNLEAYAPKYKLIKFERRDGILQMTLHRDGGELVFGVDMLEELSYVFYDIARDPQNRVVILTGTGENFSGSVLPFPGEGDPAVAFDIVSNWAIEMLNHLLNVPVPMIAAVRGRAALHPEIAVLCDVVLASEDATFEDVHFPNGGVPGDGGHIIWPLLMGWNRGRHFLLTGQKLSAQEAFSFGLVTELVPRQKLLPRAWEVAEYIVSKPPLTTRYTRRVIAQHLRRMILDYQAFGFGWEGLAGMRAWGGSRSGAH